MYYSKLTLLPLILFCVVLTVQADDASTDSPPVNELNTETVVSTECSNTTADDNTELSDTPTEADNNTECSDTPVEEAPIMFKGAGGYALEEEIIIPSQSELDTDEEIIDPAELEENKEYFDPKSWALYVAVEEAIKKGGGFVGPAALHWHRKERCSGCHIQTQSLMGMALAIEKSAEIDQNATNFLYNTVGASGHDDGSLWISHGSRREGQTALGLWSLTGWSDKAFSFFTKYKAAQYFHNLRKQTNHWYSDGGHHWWNNDIAQTALVTIGMADVLKTAPALKDQQEYRLLETADLGSGDEVRDIEQYDGALYVLKINGQVNRIDMETGQTTTFITGLPKNSTGLAIATDGTLYISGDNGRLIQAQRDNWQYVGDHYYGTIRDVEIGPDNHLYLSDQKYHRILTVSLNGTLIDTLIDTKAGLYNPTGLTFDSKGNLYIANYSGYNILKMNSEGTITTFADGLPFPPMWLDVDSKDELYVSAKDFSFDGYTPYGMYRINQNGNAQRIVFGSKIFGVVQANGKMWAANATTDKLNEINPIPLDMQLLPQFEKDIKAAVGYFMKNYGDNSSDKAVHALRLMALGEARLVLTDSTILAKIDRAIYAEEQWLRKRQNLDGGWGRYNNQASDALITSMVGLGLEYSNPMKNDLMVRKAVMYLLGTQAGDGSWQNRNNGLTTRLAATSFVMAYLPKALERLRPLTNAEFNAILAGTTTASCKFYALNDKDKSHSQLLAFEPDSRMENFVVNQVGRTLKGFDLEGLAIHPITRIIYTTSSVDAGLGKFPGHLYVIDAKTGEITLPIGPTGFDEVDSITFASDGTLWGWARSYGLISIDIRTGQGTLVLPSDVQVEDLTLSKTEEMVFYGAVNAELWKFQPATNSLEVQCNNLPEDTESLEMLTDNLLLLGTHKGDLLQVFDIARCQVETAIRIPTDKFNDVEGIGVIVEECPLGELVEKALDLMESEPDKQICLPLEHFDIGQSIEDFDILYPGFSLATSSGKSKIIAEGKEPAIYEADGKINGCIDRGIANQKSYLDYVFRFGFNIKEFSLQVHDSGDFIPIEDSAKESNADESSNQAEEPDQDEEPIQILQHSVSLEGHNEQEKLVSDNLNYVTEAGVAYRNGEFFGTGDACQDELGQLGNYPFSITGSGINKVKLKFHNSKISDPEFAISNICFTQERLPTNLLRFLPKNYVSEHISDFIDELQHERINKFSEQYIIDNLVRLQSQFFRDYVNGLPGEIIQDFFAEELYAEIETDYPKRLVDDILEEFPQDFQDRFKAEFPLLFLEQPQLNNENKLMDHLEYTRSSLVERHQYLEKFLPHFGGEIPVDLLRNILSDEAGDMFTGILTALVKESSSKDSLADVLETLPDFIVNKLLDKQDDK